MKTRQSTTGRRGTKVAWLVVLVALLALASTSLAGGAKDERYVFTSFDPPGSVLTFCFGINNNGLITIQYNDAAGYTHAVTLKDGKYTNIDMPGAIWSGVSAPNMEGQVALGYVTSTDPNMHTALYTRGHFTPLPDAPGYANVSPSAINARGDISGVVWTGDFVFVHGYIWNGKSYTVFDHPATDVQFTLTFGINNQGHLVGQYNTSDGVIHGFLKEGNNCADIVFPGAPNTVPFSINNSGVIVGLYGEAGPGPFGFEAGARGFVLRHGVYTTLDYPGAATSFPIGINDTGHIVGVYQDAAGNFHGYLAKAL